MAEDGLPKHTRMPRLVDQSEVIPHTEAREVSCSPSLYILMQILFAVEYSIFFLKIHNLPHSLARFLVCILRTNTIRIIDPLKGIF